jgi:meiotically up-regulated gene 157 (Mug157) protein
MWLRDSTAQVWPYLPLMKNDSNLQQLIAGVINRQTRCILKDPYANAFYKDENKVSQWKSDRTEMKPGVHERKWEVDSLCYPIRLAYHYFKLTNDRAPLDASWREAVLLILKTFREQQRKNGLGPYRFQRRTEVQSDTLAGGGYGLPTKPVGLICSMFRPSDDATVFAFLVPSNFFAVVSLRQAADLLTQIHHDQDSAAQCRALADEVEGALRKYAVVIHEKYGRILPYEIDGYGDYYCIDDGNVPSLLSLPYIDAVGPGDPLYLNTRHFVLSDSNPYYCIGKAAAGPGGPHVGRDMIWPLGLIVQGLTSASDAEIRQCIDTLRRTHARGLQQRRPKQVHPLLVRLGQYDLWRAGAQDLPGTAAGAKLTRGDCNLWTVQRVLSIQDIWRGYACWMRTERSLSGGRSAANQWLLAAPRPPMWRLPMTRSRASTF